MALVDRSDAAPSPAEAAAARLLGVPVGAERSTVERAFRRLATEAHPDRGGDARHFRDLLAARQLLTAAGSSPTVAARPRPDARAAKRPSRPLRVRVPWWRRAWRRLRYRLRRNRHRPPRMR